MCHDYQRTRDTTISVVLSGVARGAEGADRPRRKSGGGGKMENVGDNGKMVVIMGAPGILRLLGRQNCSPPRVPITHATPLVALCVLRYKRGQEVDRRQTEGTQP